MGSRLVGNVEGEESGNAKAIPMLGYEVQVVSGTIALEMSGKESGGEVRLIVWGEYRALVVPDAGWCDRDEGGAFGR